LNNSKKLQIENDYETITDSDTTNQKISVQKKAKKKMKLISYSLCILCMTFILSNSIKAQPVIDFESGIVFTCYNDVRIPGDEGTFFSLADDLKSKEKIFYRLRACYILKSRHTVSLLYAPLKTKSEGDAATDILFEGKLFPANTPLTGAYKFNSYRLTYRYDLINKSKIIFGLGLTAKIRDAAISLTSSDLSAEKTNIGFVPLINFNLRWKITDKAGLLLDGDALAAPQGRAEDILIAATYKITDNINVRGGYRMLEGGADNDEVYNFALFHYASAGITYIFKNNAKAN
jgi:hypothetical protein